MSLFLIYPPPTFFCIKLPPLPKDFPFSTLSSVICVLIFPLTHPLSFIFTFLPLPRGLVFPISLTRSLVPCYSLLYSFPKPPILFYFPGFCGYSKLYNPIWEFGARIIQWERTCDTCLSAFVLTHSMWSCLAPPIYLQSWWVHFSLQQDSIL